MKKRLLSIVLSLCMVLALMPMTAFAETSGSTEDGFSYTISDYGEVTITGYTGSATEITIPDTIDGYPVKAIGDSAFYYCTTPKSVNIPDGVTSIGYDAFYNCGSLESINIPDSVTSIGDRAFTDCFKLEIINIPDSVKFIGESAFYNCVNLTEITVDEDNEYYSSVNGVLLDKNKTRLLVIPGGYTGTFDIPDTVTAIEDSASYYCSKLEGVTIPTGVTAIGFYVFMLCDNLKSVTIPSSVKTIGRSAFHGCTSLEYINIPDSVTSIGESAFYYCTSLKSIVIPHKVTAISDRTFTFDSSLENVFLSDKVTSIGVAAIPDTASQIRYSLDETAGKVTITDVSLGSGRTAVEIPSYIDGYPVSAVKASAFDGCDSLERIFLPENISVPDGEIPDTATKISYSLDTERGEVTVTEINLGYNKTSVDIPKKIFGYPVAAVATSEQSKVGAHTCKVVTATCTAKAVCSLCGQVLSEKNPDNHSGSMVCDTNETQHKKYWNCCDAVVTDYEDHTWNNGVCSVCDYVCEHSGGEANCTDKAECEYCGEEYGELDSSNHDLENIPAKDATVTETGNIEYWQCENCKGCFSDKDGKNSIDIADTVTKKLPPEIIEGMDQSVIAGEKKALSFTSNAAFDDFKRVGLDGSELSEEYYEKAEGSIIITLDADYVATLPVGEHTIGIVSESGTAETAFTVEEKAAPGTSDDSDKDNSSDKDNDSKIDSEDSVKTGDNTNLALWIALMLLCGAGITGNTIYTRRKRTNE